MDFIRKSGHDQKLAIVSENGTGDDRGKVI